MTSAIGSWKQKDIDEMHQYYRDIINCMPNIIYLLDKRCILTGCNTNFRSLLDIKPTDELLGVSPYKKMVLLAQWSEERVDRFKQDDINALLSGEPMFDVEETPVFTEQGGFVYYRSSRIPLQNAKNEVIGLVVILTDVTQQRKIEEQLEKIKEQLQLNNTKKESKSVITNRNSDKPPKFLMIEDNTIAQKATQAILMQLDCHVDVAESGDKAASLFEPGKYDLVFMDIGLEDTSGYMVSKKIRQLEQETQYHVPIIALTGYQADVVQYDCIDYSMEGALTKPLTSEQAKQIIQHYVYNIDIPIRGLKNIKNSIDRAKLSKFKNPSLGSNN